MIKAIITGLLFCLLADGTFAQNVGIGTNNATHKLDVAGRVRIRQNNNQTAGIWFDGSNGTQRSFAGTYDENHAGWYGISSGWSLTMNVVNGHVGIGNSNPGASLDVNGTLRFRGGNFPHLPATGAVLTSVDDEGNTQWQRPVLFKTNGLAAELAVPAWQWKKIMFNIGTEVNQGLHYDFINSLFNAPVKGFYHFDAKVYILSSVLKNYIRLVVVRNGVVVREFRDQELVCDEYCANKHVSDFKDLGWADIAYKSLSVSVGTLLEKGDQVWVEVYRSAHEDIENGGTWVLNAASTTWFNGYLVSRL